MRIFRFTAIFFLSLSASAQYIRPPADLPYQLLATSRTSTMEKELNDAASAGYRLQGIMSGDTGAGEVITVMSRTGEKDRFSYKLLATGRTSTMQKELQAASDEGWEYRGHFARAEVMVILERDREKSTERYEYLLLATSRTSTLEKELNQAIASGYEFLTIFRRAEVMAIVRRPALRK